MRGLVQRVSGAQVSVAGEVIGAIRGPGLLLLVGVTHSDTEVEARKLADKVYRLRIFDDAGQGAEVSAADLALPVLVVSQFTLYGSTDKGRRPTWEAAAPGSVAEPLVTAVVERLRVLGAQVATGSFGADMAVQLVNDGPITLLIEV
ncbi:MAG TPA: D-aminoacyl-tRNA deacylase [Actinomycetota bacterium]|nr:D-aminoacyl-tRNA deacylase [Actinomycetota bacterium]